MGKQKRSINTYQKIDTIFKRDINNIIMPFDGFVSPELEYLRGCKFDAEEKIDGTNTRIEVVRKIEYDVDLNGNVDAEINYDRPIFMEWSVSYKGKTDNATLPPKLMTHLQENYPEDKVLAALGLKKKTCLLTKDNSDAEYLTEKGWMHDDNGVIVLDLDKIPSIYTIYGEGYGVKIQGCGGSYLTNSNSFIGFDVKVNDVYLLKDNRDDVLTKLGCPIVPFIGQFTIDEAIEFVRKGFTSRISEDKNFLAEGLVLRTPLGLKNRRGERIIFKVKTCDFVKYRAKYGTDDKVEQTPNPHI